MLKSSLFGLGLGGLWFAACSSGAPDSFENGNVPLAVAGFANAGSSIAGSAGLGVAGVASDGTGYDNGCSLRVTDDTIGVFVSAAAGTDVDTCGGRAQPCKTIVKAMSRAQGLKPVVYVANGTYQESLSLVPGLRLEGGWTVEGNTWTPDCTADATIIQNDRLTTLTADELGGAAELGFLSVNNAHKAVNGESVFGIVARGASTQLLLEEVRVYVPKAADGDPGKSGDYGYRGDIRVTGGCDPSYGTPGEATGKRGADGQPGQFASDGFHPGHGVSGSNGSDGNAGLKPTVSPTCVTGCSVCKSNGTCKSAPDSCGTAGKAGCGGGAGEGGEGGKGGGSSVALFIWDASVSVYGGLYRAADAGRGGIGGLGGEGGEGGPGIAGQAAASACTTPVSCPGSAGYQSAPCLSTIGTGAPGNAGGLGGNGTDGGDGGDGSGGFSYAIFRNRAECLTLVGAIEQFGKSGGAPIKATDGDSGAVGSP